MARLIYSAIASLDGYIEDEKGQFDWAVPDDEVHAFINDLQRPIGSYLYGRRMYETMRAWETLHAGADQPVVRDFAEIWRPAHKIVYSKTLPAVSTPKTRLERDFDAASVQQMKDQAERDLSVSGPDLAAAAFAARLIDELHMFVVPVLIGGGKQSLPDGVRLKLQLLDERRFGNGMVYLHYEAAP